MLTVAAAIRGKLDLPGLPAHLKGTRQVQRQQLSAII